MGKIVPVTTNDVHPRSRFGLFYASFLVSGLGDAFRLLAVNVWIFQASEGSTAERLLLVLLANVPGMLLGGLSGVMADRYDKFAPMVASDLIRVVTGLGLAWCAAESATTSALVLVGIGNTAGVFFATSSFSLLPKLVSADRLPRANGLLESGQWVLQIVGPSLAAATLATTNATVAFAIDSATFAVSAVILWSLRKVLRQNESKTAPQDENESRSHWQDFVEGIGLIWRDRSIRALLLASYGVTFLTACTSFALIYLILSTLRASTQTLGFVYSLNGIVAVGAAVLTSALLSTRRLGPVMAAGVTGLCVAQVVMGLAPNIWVLGIGVVVSALANAPYNVAVTSLYMTRVPERFLGRVEGVDSMIDNTIRLVAYAVSFAVLSAWDARVVFVLSALAALPSVYVAWVRVARRTDDATGVDLQHQPA
jgi:hypothetical protein